MNEPPYYCADAYGLAGDDNLPPGCTLKDIAERFGPDPGEKPTELDRLVDGYKERVEDAMLRRIWENEA